MSYENLKSPWGTKEKEIWFQDQTIKRSYLNEVVSKINQLKNNFEISQYGALSLNPSKYPLFIHFS